MLAVVGGLVVLIVFMAAGAAGVVTTVLGGAHQTRCTFAGDETPAVPGYTPEQLANATTIITIGKQLNVPERGWIIALVTAIQESRLRNLDYGDRDSLGLFQQRPSQGWGKREQLLNPTYSATQFYRHLLAVPDWPAMSINDAAQTVQRSGFPHAYARHEPAARQLLTALHGHTCTRTPAAGEWAVPVQGQCTSRFGPRGTGFHRGLDIAAPLGTPILAAGSGTVLDSGPASGYGLWIRIQHRDGTITTYGHNNRNHTQPGQQVRTGQLIAEVGNRGESTGPHLHFQIEQHGQPTDPVAFFRRHGGPTLCDQ
ncbi:M23 family metallopeptidase [Saccharopolyspora spinosa]|uniref:Murein DD-endopeptidase MepM/ murein hydrolase activator NlpD n=1 Tax=Saccharopolyspora spinosa TaxID=60894 RepID=A0A2N3Y782_SACSN|nr:M23 family metallopeptidase [Saccharopolyspora spinosa]PKW18777.1 murein DD-endopeptidase MepM/ murein hydrolase activator NlpD [Saccharopolyspora spinosa]